MKYLHKMKDSFVYRFLVGIVLFTFVLATPGISYAQALNLPAPGTMLGMSPAFAPPLIKGLMINPDNPLQFDFLIDPGNADFRGKSQSEKAEEYRKLVKYFLASLTVPEEDLWVNLSPYEKDRIIADGFGKTEMGRDLLSQDYILKQLAASLMYPEKELGKKFWAKVYKEAQEKFGTIDIPVNTFNKVWIIPDSASVYEKDNTVFLVESHLKVMLEEDYVALDHNSLSKELGTNQLVKKEVQDVSSLSSKIVREVIIPAIEKEVNEGKNFALLRQINNSLILATWYKTALKESLLGKVYVNRSKTEGITQEDIEDNQKIYAQYLEAFKKGVYNYIKEEYDPVSEETIPRKYFSGGFGTINRNNPNRAMLAQRIERSGDPAMLARAGQVTGAERVQVVLEEPEEQVNRAMMGSPGQEPSQADLRDLVVDALQEMSADTNALGNALRASVRRSQNLNADEARNLAAAIQKWVGTKTAKNNLAGVKEDTDATVNNVLWMVRNSITHNNVSQIGKLFEERIDFGKFALELQKNEIARRLADANDERDRLSANGERIRREFPADLRMRQENTKLIMAQHIKISGLEGLRRYIISASRDRAMMGGGVGTDVAVGGEYTVEKLRELFTRISDQEPTSDLANVLNLFPILTRLNETLTSLKSNNEDLPLGSIRLTLENLMEAVRGVLVDDSNKLVLSSSIIKSLSEAETEYHDSPGIQKGDTLETIRALEEQIDSTVNESESSWTKIYVLSRLAIHYIGKAESYGRIIGDRDVFDNPIEPKVRYFQDRYEATKEKLIEVLKSMLVLKEDAFVNYRVLIDEKTSGNIHLHLWQKGFIDAEGLVTDNFYSGTTAASLDLSAEYGVAIREWILKVLNVAVGRKPEGWPAADRAMMVSKLGPVLDKTKEIVHGDDLFIKAKRDDIIRILTSLITQEDVKFFDLFAAITGLQDVEIAADKKMSGRPSDEVRGTPIAKVWGAARLAQDNMGSLKVVIDSDWVDKLRAMLETVKEIEGTLTLENRSIERFIRQVISSIETFLENVDNKYAGDLFFMANKLREIDSRLYFSYGNNPISNQLRANIETVLKGIEQFKVVESSDRAMMGSAEDLAEQVVFPLIFSGVLGGSETIYAGDTIFTSNKPIKIIDITRSSGGEWEISLASDIYDYQRGPDRLRIKVGSVNRAKDGEIVYKKDNGEDVGRLTKKGDNQWTWAAGGSIELAEDGTLKITKGSEVITAKKAGDHWEVGQFLAKKNSAGDWFIVKQKIPSIEDPESALHGALQMAYTYYLGLVEEGALREALELIDSGYGVIHDFKRSSFVDDPWDRNAEDTAIEKLLARIVEAIGRKKNSFKNSFERIEELNRILRERNLFEFVGSIPDNVKNEVEKLRGGEELSRLELIRVNRLLLEENFGVPVYKWLEEPESLKAMLDSPSQIGPFTGLNDDEVKQKLTIAGERIRAELDRRASNRMIDDYEDPLLTARERKNLIEMMLNTLATDASVRAWIPETIQRDEEDVAIDMLRVASLKREDYVVLDERQRSLIGRMNREMGAELAKNLKIVHMYGNREWEDKGYFVVEKGESTSDAVEVVGAIKDILESWLLLEEVKSINPSRLWDMATVETKKILIPLLEKIIRSDGGDIAALLMRLGGVIDYFQYHQGDIYVIPARLQSQGGDNSEEAKALKKAMVRIKDAMGRLTITEDSKRGLDKAVGESLSEVGKIGSVKEFPGNLLDLPEDPDLTALVKSLLAGILNSNGNDILELLIRFGEIQHRLIHNFLDDSPNVAALKKVMAELKETMGRLTIIPSDSAFVDRAMLVSKLGPILEGVKKVFVLGTEPVVQDIKEKLITILYRLIDTDASSLKITEGTGDVEVLKGLSSELITRSDSRAATELNLAINAVLKALGSLSIVEPPADYRISPEGMTRLGGLLSEIEALTADPSELNPDTTPGAAVLIGPRQTLLNLLKNLLAPESSNRSAQNLHEFTYAFTPSGQQEEFRNALAGAVEEIKGILNRSSVLASLGRSTFFGDQEYRLTPSLGRRFDRAMNAGDAVGGIDLNPANLNLQIKRDGNGVPLPLPMQDIPNINVNGFIPVIINIQPIPNLPQLLGADTTPKDKQPQLSSI